MGRLANSWQIVKASGRVIRQDKELLVLPVLSFLASVVIFAGVLGAAWTQGIFPQFTDAEGNVQPMAMLLGGLLYLGLAFVNVFFGAAIVAGANERLAGGDPTLGSCLRAAGRHWGRLLVWAAITATVSILLQMLRERGGLAGKLIAGLGSMAWALATYFVIPVLLFEDGHVGKAMARSGALFRKTWGETVIGTGGVGLVFMVGFFVLALPIGLVVASGNLALIVPVVVACALAMVFLAVLQSAFSGVYKGALYRYAATGQVPPGFEPTQIQGAFVAK